MTDTVSMPDLLEHWALDIDRDGTPSQAGPTSDELRQLAETLRAATRTQEPADWRAVVTDIRDLCSRRPALSGRTKDEITSVALSNSADLAHIMRLCNSLLKMPRAASITPPAPERKEVGVKALEWSQSDDSYWRGVGSLDTYSVTLCRDGSYEMDGELYPDLRAAKAAAQADYDQRIKSALTPSPIHKGEADYADYDAGLLNDFGGGDVGWWQDYLRAEIDKANDFWREQVASPVPLPVTDETERNILAWVREDVLPAYGITHNARASDPEMVEGLRAALSKPGEQG